MDMLQSREQLDATHQFPGKFLFKAIGRTEDDFADQVVAVVREVLVHDFDSPCELRETPAGRHVSVSIEPWIESSDQVLLVYAALRNLPGLVMLM